MSLNLSSLKIEDVVLSKDTEGGNTVLSLQDTLGSVVKLKGDVIPTLTSDVIPTDAIPIDGSTNVVQSGGLFSSLAAKAPIESPTFTGTVSGIDKSMVGLSNVDNTSDADKPVSTSIQTALNPLVSAPTFNSGTNMLEFTSTDGTASSINLGTLASSVNLSSVAIVGSNMEFTLTDTSVQSVDITTLLQDVKLSSVLYDDPTKTITFTTTDETGSTVLSLPTDLSASFNPCVINGSYDNSTKTLTLVNVDGSDTDPTVDLSASFNPLISNAAFDGQTFDFTKVDSSTVSLDLHAQPLSVKGIKWTPSTLDSISCTSGVLYINFASEAYVSKQITYVSSGGDISSIDFSGIPSGGSQATVYISPDGATNFLAAVTGSNQVTTIYNNIDSDIALVSGDLLVVTIAISPETSSGAADWKVAVAASKFA